jgi:hypothetical protein
MPKLNKIALKPKQPNTNYNYYKAPKLQIRNTQLCIWTSNRTTPKHKTILENQGRIILISL